MKTYVLDTNVLIHFIRQSDTWKKIHQQYAPLANNSYLSFVTVAEAISFAIRLEWDKTGREAIQDIINSLTVIHSSENLTDYYVDIASFSQGIHSTLKLPKNVSARNMGENDIWIAATTKSIEGAELITTDRDFEHLDGIFFGVNYVQL